MTIQIVHRSVIAPLVAAATKEHVWVNEPKGMIWFGAFDDGRLVGFGGLIANNRRGSLRAHYVVPERRRQGIGRALVEARLAEAKRRGCQYVIVPVNTVAIPFHEALGFYPTGRVFTFGAEYRMDL